MSLQQRFMSLASGVVIPVVTVSGEVVIDIGGGVRTYRARISIVSDGTVDGRENNTTTQRDASTDWIIPNGAAPDDYEARFINRTGFVPNGSTNLVEDVWAAVSTSRHVEISQSLSAAQSESATFDIEVRKGSAGGALDSASYNLQIERIF